MSFRARPGPGTAVALPRELAFLIAQGVDPHLLARACAIAQRSGCEPNEALIRTGLVDEETYYRALARAIGAPFLTTVSLGATRYPQVLQVGGGPLAEGSPARHVVAPRGGQVAALIEAVAELGRPPAVTTPTRLRDAAFARHAAEIAASASDDLGRRHPDWSCRPGPRMLTLAGAGAALGAVLLTTNLPFGIGLTALIALQFGIMAMLGLRLGAVVIGAAVELARSRRDLPEDRLPCYTVMVALAREASVVPKLVRSLDALDYPRAKLQILFLIEADDPETAQALEAERLGAHVEVVVCPAGMPRTKPRALNIGLPLARGDLLVVYDAEDAVDPRQLRKAAALFARAPARTACLQGRLVIDNPGDGLLQTLFAIEYSALFDVLGPALAVWKAPTPLGGTTTHFRTRTLRKLSGWDAWNVTEDADLGMRLALAGYHVGDLPSPTYEEAPRDLQAWLRQRTRWIKGFMQTSWTHGRHPLAAVRQLGPVKAFGALTLLPGTIVSALAYPFFALPAAYRIFADGIDTENGLLAIVASGTALLVFVAGLAAMILPGLLGCLRRGWIDLAPFALLLPLYYLLVCAAAWLAVIELIRHPYRWNKTEHGLARTSRSGALDRFRRPTITASPRARSPSPTAAVPG